MTRETLHARPIFLNETHLHLLLESVQGKKILSISRDLDIWKLYTANFEKSSDVKIFCKNGGNCPKPIFRLLSGTRSVPTMIRRENQIFSEQTLPALMVLNDPADHIKQKIFFLGKLSCQHFGFSIGFEIDNNLSSQHQFIWIIKREI